MSTEPKGPYFTGHEPRECGEHRTVGTHRAWCFDCGEWCYPKAPCVRCEIATLREVALVPVDEAEDTWVAPDTKGSERDD